MGLYWVRTPTFWMPELTQLDNAKSMIRNFPPKGTAGLARHSVNILEAGAATAGEDKRYRVAGEPADEPGLSCGHLKLFHGSG